jgi:hypothetical protein
VARFPDLTARNRDPDARVFAILLRRLGATERRPLTITREEYEAAGDTYHSSIARGWGGVDYWAEDTDHG